MSNLAMGGASPDSPALVDGRNARRSIRESQLAVSSSGDRIGRLPNTRVLAVCVVALLSGCAGSVIDGTAGPNPRPPGDGGSPPPWDGPGGPPGGDESCTESTLETQTLFSAMCSRCHGEVGSGGLANIDDVGALVRTGRVVPGDPEASPIYRRVAAGTMPPTGASPRPTDAQVGSLQAWIRCGAPAFPAAPPPPSDPATVDQVMRWMADDLRRFDNRAQRLSKRYIILTHRANAGATAGEMSQLRDAVDLLVNHLSRGTRVVSPTPIDAGRTVLRIDLDDYAWDASTWDRIVARYPYGVQYDDRSTEFPFDSAAQQFIQSETGEEIPFVFADWFVAYASQPPLYYDVLRLPRTVQELYAELGVRFDQDQRDGNFIRAGFAVSGVSVSNRIIQRNVAVGGGYVWTSFDFLNSSGRGNIFDSPVDFEEDGGEVIFSLPNQLQGYYIQTAAGDRLDTAPQAVVSDPRTPDRSVIAGLSCMGCHDSGGMIPRDDEIRAHVIATSPGGAERDLVLRTHPPRDQLQDVFQRDTEAYQAARARIGRDGRSQPVPDTAISYLEIDRSIRDLAALLWLSPDRVRDAILVDINLSRAFRALVTTSSGRVAREELEDQFDNLVCSIGVGRPVCTGVTQGSPCGCVDP